MNYELFENEQEKGEAIAALTGFTDLAGWKLILKAIDGNIQFREDKLRERIESKRDFENLEQLYAEQDRIDDLRAFRELPAKLMHAAQPEEEEEPEEQIYDTPEPDEPEETI